MLNNSVKDQIRTALETAGVSTCSSNIEVIYQIFMTGGSTIGTVIRQYKWALKK